MSAEATGWVFRESPYVGAMFTLHLAIADTVNDAHENQLWAAVPTLAEKARVSERSVRSGLAQMVGDGLLDLTAAPPGKPREYRFQMPANPGTQFTPAVAAPLQPATTTPATSDQTPATRRKTPAVAAPKHKNPIEPKGSQSLEQVAAVDGFDEFWMAYPKRKGKGAARIAWAKALERAPAALIIAGAIAYADDPDRQARYTKYPQGWLSEDRWTDEYAQDRTHSKGTQTAMRFAARHRDEPKEIAR